MGPSVRFDQRTGGGLPTPYRDGEERVDIAAYYRPVGRNAEATGRRVRPPGPPGNRAGPLSGGRERLVLVPRSVPSSGMGDNLFYLVDAGFNNLARPILYGAYHPMAVCHVGRGQSSKIAASGRDARQELHQVIVGGPLCESGDIFTQEDGGYVKSRPLPEASVGDLLVIGCTGAYGAVMGSNYNSKPMAAEVLLDGGKAHEIRRRQTFEEMVTGESIPAR